MTTTMPVMKTTTILMVHRRIGEKRVRLEIVEKQVLHLPKRAVWRQR